MCLAMSMLIDLQTRHRASSQIHPRSIRRFPHRALPIGGEHRLPSAVPESPATPTSEASRVPNFSSHEAWRRLSQILAHLVPQDAHAPVSLSNSSRIPSYSPIHRNLVTSLFEHEQISTTLPKARDTARLAEKVSLSQMEFAAS